MTPDEAIDAAAREVAAERDAKTAWEDHLYSRDQAVRVAYTANPDLGPTELAGRLGLSPSTVRQITADLARERRRQRG